MKILMLAEDPNICVSGSNARKRMERYAKLFDELHVVAPATAAIGLPEQRKKPARTAGIIQSGGLFLYPVAAGNRLLQRWHMYRIASSLPAGMHFDMVTSQGPDEVGLIAYRIARYFGVKLQLQVHTDLLSLWYRRASWKERIRYLLARFLLPRADCVRAVSERIKHSLVTNLHIPESRISVLPIFTDLSVFSGASPKSEDLGRLQGYAFRMIAVGRFVDKEKNFTMLIRMMAEFVKQQPDAVLVLVGGGPDRTNYELQITNNGLKKNVIIEPWRDNLASFYKCFDVALISSNYEGWGLVAIEAMAAGVPVVMTDVGLAGEVVKDGINGRVVPVGDPAAFLEAVLDLFRHPEKRRILAEAGRRTVIPASAQGGSALGGKPQSEEEYFCLYRESFERCTAL